MSQTAAHSIIAATVVNCCFCCCCPPQGGTKSKPTPFTFDAVLEQDSTQAAAFDAIAKETIADVLKGYNGQREASCSRGRARA